MIIKIRTAATTTTPMMMMMMMMMMMLNLRLCSFTSQPWTCNRPSRTPPPLRRRGRRISLGGLGVRGGGAQKLTASSLWWIISLGGLGVRGGGGGGGGPNRSVLFLGWRACGTSTCFLCAGEVRDNCEPREKDENPTTKRQYQFRRSRWMPAVRAGDSTPAG